MKTFTTLMFLLLLMTTAFAKEGIVIAHSAPLFLSPNINTVVVQWVPKGKKIYLHDSGVVNGDGISFYKTLDKSAREVFIDASYVKMITHTDEESGPPKVLPSDSTDYRQNGLLKKGYPFKN